MNKSTDKPLTAGEQRHARRERRRRRFDAPIDKRSHWWRAWASMFFVDHGFFRYIYLNKHEVAPGVFRAAQPAPHHIRQFAEQGGKTVLYLRHGIEFGSWQLEKEACEQYGLTLIQVGLKSRELPSLELLEELAEVFLTAERPVLFHCKSGADRTGLAGALWRLIVEGASVEEAREQLSPKYGHIRSSRTGVLDAMIDAYERDTKDDPKPFMDWARESYDPEAIKAGFKPTSIWGFIVDKILRRE
jgi:protein tyrosine/serine phosphatase